MLINQCNNVGIVNEIKEIADELRVNSPKIYYAGVKNILDDILKLRHSISLEKYRSEFFLECNEVLSAKHSKYKETTEKTLSQLRERVVDTENELTKCKQEISDRTAEISRLNAEKSYNVNTITSQQHALVVVRDENHQLKTTINTLVQTNADNLKRIDAFETERMGFFEIERKLNEQLTKMTADSEATVEKLTTDNELVSSTYQKKLAELTKENTELKKFKADKRLDVMMQLMMSARVHVAEYDKLNDQKQQSTDCMPASVTGKQLTDCRCVHNCVCDDVHCACYPVCMCDNKITYRSQQKFEHQPWCCDCE